MTAHFLTTQGLGGDDIINGNSGNDYINGGSGDDKLNGGSGDDTYVFGKDSGNDSIYDYSGVNRIIFKDFLSSDMTVSYATKNTYDEVLKVNETGQTLTFTDFCYSTDYRNFTLEFSNGDIGHIDYSLK